MIKLGLVYIGSGALPFARHRLEEALKLERASASPRDGLLRTALLDLSYIARHDGRAAEALELVDAAAAHGLSAIELALNRGMAYAELGDLASAERELARAESLAPEDGWAWWVPYQRGNIALRAGRLADADAAYRRAIAAAAALRDHPANPAANVIGSDRGAHLRLLGLLARAGRWHDALGVVAGLDASGGLRVELPPAELLPSGDLVRPFRGPSLVAPAAVVASIDVDALIDAWRGRTLVVIASDFETMWRIVVADGVVTGTAIGSATELEQHAARLEADPDPASPDANALAAAMIPTGLAEADVVLIGKISRLPLATLAAAQRRGAPLRLLRPDVQPLRLAVGPRVARVLGILPRVSALSAPTDPAVVLGDPTATVPAARAEATAVADRLGVGASLGTDATWDALARARHAAVLHLAVHVEATLDGPHLVLADGTLTTADVAGLGLAPRLVMLASCGGSAARDDTGWGSLASAFLNGGAEFVVASSSTVGDDEARRLVEAFYAAGGAADPVAALAVAQRELARGSEVSARALLGFTVLRAPPAAR